MENHVIVIGAGFAGLAAATTLAARGHRVTLLEKNEQAGGRARRYEAEGFTFDMGPSWYWMPDVFEDYFGRFGKKVSDYYQLERMDPSYSIYFENGDRMDVPAGEEALTAMFERLEPGSGAKLQKFLEQAEYKYRVGMDEFVHKPGHSIMEFADLRVFASLFRLQMFSSIAKHVRAEFKHPQLRQLLEFPVLFLGATPQRTPALYSLMNYADLRLGTWYPQGGMHEIVRGMVSLAEEMGVDIRLNEPVTELRTTGGRVTEVVTTKTTYHPAGVIAGADYHHVEQNLLATADRTYDEAYWQKRSMAPSSLLFYVGVEGRIPGLHHHTLFFDEDFDRHAYDIYEQPAWPEKPLFYVCAPSVSDENVAPAGHENLFFLIPLAPGLDDTEAAREKYWPILLDRFARHTGTDISERIVYRRSYAHRDFISDYHAYRGNAYGLANTLLQTAFLKPKMAAKKVSNLLFAGQLTTPGPGVPPSLISGQVAAVELEKIIGPAVPANTIPTTAP